MKDWTQISIYMLIAFSLCVAWDYYARKTKTDEVSHAVGFTLCVFWPATILLFCLMQVFYSARKITDRIFGAPHAD